MTPKERNARAGSCRPFPAEPRRGRARTRAGEIREASLRAAGVGLLGALFLLPGAATAQEEPSALPEEALEALEEGREIPPEVREALEDGVEVPAEELEVPEDGSEPEEGGQSDPGDGGAQLQQVRPTQEAPPLPSDDPEGSEPEAGGEGLETEVDVPGARPESGEAEAGDIITVARGNSAVVSHPINLERVLVTDPELADVVTVSAREVVVNGVKAGTTTLLLWDSNGERYARTVRITADAATIQGELRRMFPDESIFVSAVGNTLILQGETRNPQVAQRAVALAGSLENEADVLDYIVVPDRGQVLLRVRVAEVNRSALRDLGAHISRVNPLSPRGDDEGMIAPGGVTAPGGGFMGLDGPDHTFSDAINFFLFHEGSNVAAFIQALQSEGLFRSLAEPNLLTLPGETASFLAGGEFPYPVVQAGAQAGAVTIQFQEFGVRLRFTPQITNAGTIRMEVEPEVSSLDFAGGVEVGGFRVPVLLSRRAHTNVEVDEGQTFAIAGLMDSQLQESVRKVPVLGDIPILGALFRSTSYRQEQTELLVLVTPHLVGPDEEAPELPTGELETWEWVDFMDPERLGPPEGGSDDAGGDGDGDDDDGPFVWRR